MSYVSPALCLISVHVLNASIGRTGHVSPVIVPFHESGERHADRRTSIFNHLSYLMRLGKETDEYRNAPHLAEDAWGALGNLRDASCRARPLKVDAEDLMTAAEAFDKHGKNRFATNRGARKISIRDCQAKLPGSVRDDSTIKRLPNPGFLTHPTTRASLGVILKDGMRVAGRNSIRMVPESFDSRLENYLAAKKCTIPGDDRR